MRTKGYLGRQAQSIPGEGCLQIQALSYPALGGPAAGRSRKQPGKTQLLPSSHFANVQCLLGMVKFKDIQVFVAPAHASSPPCSPLLSGAGGSLASAVPQGSPAAQEGDLAPPLPRLPHARASGLMSLQPG